MTDLVPLAVQSSNNYLASMLQEGPHAGQALRQQLQVGAEARRGGGRGQRQVHGAGQVQGDGQRHVGHRDVGGAAAHGTHPRGKLCLQR